MKNISYWWYWYCGHWACGMGDSSMGISVEKLDDDVL